jgi:hypothetical protein
MYVHTLIQEMKKKSKSYMIKEVKKLTTLLDEIDDSKVESLFTRGRPGIRS